MCPGRSPTATPVSLYVHATCLQATYLLVNIYSSVLTTLHSSYCWQTTLEPFKLVRAVHYSNTITALLYVIKPPHDMFVYVFIHSVFIYVYIYVYASVCIYLTSHTSSTNESIRPMKPLVIICIFITITFNLFTKIMYACTYLLHYVYICVCM